MSEAGKFLVLWNGSVASLSATRHLRPLSTGGKGWGENSKVSLGTPEDIEAAMKPCSARSLRKFIESLFYRKCLRQHLWTSSGSEREPSAQAVDQKQGFFLAVLILLPDIPNCYYFIYQALSGVIISTQVFGVCHITCLFPEYEWDIHKITFVG